MFLNLLRGTGIAGTHGILAKKENLIRPLLFAYRSDILGYAKNEKLKFREDSSNKSLKYYRNKIRNKILPLIEDFYPSYRNTLTKNTKRFREAEIVFNKEIARQQNDCLSIKSNLHLISIEKLKILNPLRIYLFEFLKEYNFNLPDSENIINSLDGISGKEFYSSTHKLIKDRDFLIISHLEERNDKKYLIKKNDIRIEIPLKLRICLISKKDFVLKKDYNIASLDFDKLKFPLILRKWQKGDYFFPLGMNKRKKLSDFFIDEKISIIEKEKLFLLCSGNDIIWISGKRIDNRYAITDKTENIYQIEL